MDFLFYYKKGESMATLKTNYKDDVFSGKRKYTQINNGDGTISFNDVTTYTQVGDSYGASEINEQNDTINNLQIGMYHKDNPTMTDVADSDYIPVYDVSAGSTKKTLWSNLKSLLGGAILPKAHGSTTASTYGAATASQYGHVKLSNSYTSSAGAADTSVGASSKAVYDAYTALNGRCDTLNTNKAKKNHADADATAYGMGTTSKYGHLKISNNYTSSAGAASDGVAASSKAVNDTYNNLNNKITNINSNISSLNSNISSLNSGKAPVFHSSSTTDYGEASTSKYGHVKLSTTPSSTATVGIAASPAAVQSVIDDFLTANSKKFTFAYDSASGKYGYKLNGSGTFYPFSDPDSFPIAVGIHSVTWGSDYVESKSFTLPKGTYRFVGITKNQGKYMASVTFTGGGISYTYESNYPDDEHVNFHYNQFTLSSDSNCTLSVDHEGSNIGVTFAIGYVYRVVT